MPRQMGGPGLLGVMLLSMLAASGEPDDSEKELPCCFRHRSYAGRCVVVAENEQCHDVGRWLSHCSSSFESR